MTDAAFWAKTMTVVGLLFVAYLLVAWAAMVFWTRRDVQSRTSDSTQQGLAVLLVALGNLPGLMLYLALRPPETTADALTRQLEAEALSREIDRKQPCPACGTALTAEFIRCPECGTTVQENCTTCARSLRAAWVLCPYCGTDRAAAPQVAAARAAGPVRIGAPYVPQSAGARPSILRPTKA
jgi:hypothetical protein